MTRVIFIIATLVAFTKMNFGQSVIPDGFKQENLEVNANSDDWTSSGIIVEKQDFVIFEVSGTVKLGSYLVSTSTGEGVPGLKPFSRFPNLWHGALICKNGNENISAHSSYHELKPTWVFGFSNDDFIGNYFISDATQELKFIVNDKDFQNNEGVYTVTVTIIPFILHKNRNQYNKCPLKQPTCDSPPEETDQEDSEEDDGCMDNKDLRWTTSIKEKYYHGGGWETLASNKTYRGASEDVKGCQCTYNNDGKLVNNNNYMGTYDYALGLPDLESRLKYHTLWDVLPHEAYIDYFEKKGKTFIYVGTKNLY